MAAWRLERRVGREVDVGVWLPRRYLKVEGLVPPDDAVLELRISGCARNAQAHVPIRGRDHGVPGVPNLRLLPELELADRLRSLVCALEESNY